MNNKLFVLISVLLAVIAIGPTFGKGKKKKATPAAAYHQTIISMIGMNAITVSDDKATRTFMVSRFTEITVNGQRGTITDLKPGMTVNVTIGTDPTHASRITAEGVPPKEAGKRSDVAVCFASRWPRASSGWFRVVNKPRGGEVQRLKTFNKYEKNIFSLNGVRFSFGGSAAGQGGRCVGGFLLQ
jgi:hypothetical protein